VFSFLFSAARLWDGGGGAVLAFSFDTVGFAFLEGSAEAIGLGAGLDDVGAVGGAID